MYSEYVYTIHESYILARVATDIVAKVWSQKVVFELFLGKARLRKNVN